MLKKEVTIEKGSKILSENPIIYIYQYNGACSKDQRFLRNELSEIEGVSALVIPNRKAHKLMAALLYSTASPTKWGKRSVLTQSSSKDERASVVKTSFNYQYNTNERLRKENIKQDSKTFLNNVPKNRTKPEKVINHSSAVTCIDFFQDPTTTWYGIKKLFQGPTLLIGCNTLDQLPPVLDILKNYANYLIIGGLFENQIITHLTSKKLVGFSKAEIHQLYPPALLDLTHYLQTLQRKACCFFLLKNCFYLFSLRLYSKKIV